MTRKRLSKKHRESILKKTDGHCAYCGIDLSYAAMQVDHVQPIHQGGVDDTDNMLPACRSCNHYKSSSTLESFRKHLEAMPEVLMRDSVTFKNAVRYGLVQQNKKQVIFYFEKGSGDND